MLHTMQLLCRIYVDFHDNAYILKQVSKWGNILNQYQNESKGYKENPRLLNYFFNLELVESLSKSVKIVLF